MTELKINAVESYDHSLDTIAGSSIVYYRINDSKKVTDSSKFFLIKLSAKRIIVLQVGYKFNKYSLTSIEYDNDHDEDWADNIRRLFSKKIILPSNATDFQTTFDLVITKNLQEK